MDGLRNLEQRRAAYAWQRAVLTQTTDYCNLAKGAPAMVMGNGLMQTLAFYQAKNKSGQKLAEDIISWLVQQNLLPETDNPDFRSAMESFHSRVDSFGYMRATDEALEILRWIRQFADALKKLTKE